MDGESIAAKFLHIAETIFHHTTYEDHPTNKLELTNVTM
jgi:hypothetical protein